MAKKRGFNLYLDEDVVKRATAALDVRNESLSQFVNDTLEQMLPILEAAASGGKSVTPETVDDIAAQFGMAMMVQGAELGDVMRTLKETLEGLEKKV